VGIETLEKRLLMKAPLSRSLTHTRYMLSHVTSKECVTGKYI
jgi:hypothetical protein